MENVLIMLYYYIFGRINKTAAAGDDFSYFFFLFSNFYDRLQEKEKNNQRICDRQMYMFMLSPEVPYQIAFRLKSQSEICFHFIFFCFFPLTWRRGENVVSYGRNI